MGRSRVIAASSSRSAFEATVQDGVLRVVDDDEARTLAEHASYAIPVEAEMRSLERNVDATPAGEPDSRVVGVIGGVEDDRFITRAHHCLDGGIDRFGASAGDRELGFRIDFATAGGHDFGGNCGAQRHAALHGCVLVEPGRNRVADAGSQSRIDGKIGEALPHVDRALLGRAARHHGEDRGAYVRQFALHTIRKNHHSACRKAAAHPRTRRLRRTPTSSLRVSPCGRASAGHQRAGR